VPNANATRNCAAAAARGSLFAFCDADDVVHPNWLDALAVAAHDADLIGGRLDVDSLNDATTTRWRPMVTRPGTAPAFGYLPYAISANMAVTRTAFMAVGGFDADIKRGSEEVDFCWRVQQAGFRFAYSADAVVSYRLRGDLRSFVRQQFRYGRAEATLYMRHRPLMQRDSLSSLGRAAWFALTRWHHVVRGAALRGRYLGYVAYRLGRLVGGLLAPIPYW
jgi:GT2 family glycosyltransferase